MLKLISISHQDQERLLALADDVIQQRRSLLVIIVPSNEELLALAGSGEFTLDLSKKLTMSKLLRLQIVLPIT